MTLSNQRSTNRAAVCIVVAVLVAAAGCSERREAPPSPLTIALSPWPGWAHAYVAREKGLFAKHNVDVDLVFKQELTEQQQLFKDGEVDGTFTLLPDVIIWNEDGIACRIVYVSDYSLTGDVIAAKPGIRSLAGLRGKRVSFEGINSFSHLFVLEALKQAELTEAEVRLVNLPAKDMAAALAQGTIDAGHTWEPFKSQVLSKGFSPLAYGRDVPGVIVDVLAFSEKVVRERPEDVRGVVAALLEALQYGRSNRREAVAIMAKHEGMTEQAVEAGLASIHQPGLDENIKALTQLRGTGSLYAAGETIVGFFMERGQLASKPDVKSLLEPRFVRAVKETQR